MTDKPQKKRKVLGWICSVWGGLVLLRGLPLLLLAPPTNAYGAGRMFGILFGGLLLYAGVRELRKPDDQISPAGVKPSE